jgi:ferredoxin/flavodoxin---NADP+ reductase
VNEILTKRVLATGVKEFVVTSPVIARKAQAGQFIVLRIDEHGERVPLTIAETDSAKGTVTIIFLEVGKTTRQLGALKQGDRLMDFIGPLGKPTHIEHYGTVVAIGGGVGVPAVLPIARTLKAKGNRVIGITGARRKDLLILEEAMRGACNELIVTTDDGSYGQKGVVTDALKKLIADGVKIDLVVAVGPAIMMKFVALTTKPHNIKTLVSLNSVMVDGTGMCGACRVTVGNKTRFVCVDGPDFDAHEVDFDELMMRQKMYLSQEKESLARYEEKCAACQREEAMAHG